MRRFIAVVLVAWGVAGLGTAVRAAGITVEHLQQMFAGMKARTKWNLDGPLLWGYFFIDPDENKLRAAAGELTRRGYRLVSINQAKDGRAYVLHVEKVEHHTVASLDRRNQELYRLAAKYQIASYDGMDAGPAP